MSNERTLLQNILIGIGAVVVFFIAMAVLIPLLKIAIALLVFFGVIAFAIGFTYWVFKLVADNASTGGVS